MTTQIAPFYEIHASDNPLGLDSVEENKFMLRRFLRLAKDIDIAADEFNSLATKLSARLGTWREGKVKKILAACHRLHTQLPQFRDHALKFGHIDYAMLTAIDHILVEIPDNPEPEFLTALDTHLVKLFTPTTTHEALPTIGFIRRRVKRFLRTHQVAVHDANKEPQHWLIFAPHSTAGTTLLTAELDSIDALTIADHIHTFARKHHCSEADALVRIINGEQHECSRRHITFGIGKFQPHQQLITEHLHGAEDLTPIQQAILAKQPTEYKDATNIATLRQARHDPTLDLRLLVILRDGTCRFPGCNTDAATCDIDHVINFEAGGWTTLSNLQCLCRHHHNAKTDRRIQATMNTQGHVTWYHADGTLIATTKPQGLLPNITGTQQGIDTRHSKKSPAYDNTNQPIRNGLGRWGSTLRQQIQRARKHRDRRPKPKSPITLQPSTELELNPPF